MSALALPKGKIAILVMDCQNDIVHERRCVRRMKHRAGVSALIEAWTARRPKHEVMQILAGAGVPCGACQDTGDILNDPHLQARDMIVAVEHPLRGRYITAGNPVKLSASPTEIKTAPLLGQHNRAILTELGYRETEISALREEGAIS